MVVQIETHDPDSVDAAEVAHALERAGYLVESVEVNGEERWAA